MNDIQVNFEALQVLAWALGLIAAALACIAYRLYTAKKDLRAKLRIEQDARTQALSDNAVLSSKLDSLQLLYTFSEQNVRELTAKVANFADLSARITHDVPKRLEYVWKYIQDKLPDDEFKKQCVNDLESIVEKIQVHVGGGIKSQVRDALENETGLSADGQMAEDFVRWLVRLHEVEGRTKVLVQDKFRLRGPRVSWDLMVTNILSNAIHYAGKNRKILIVLSAPNGRGQIDIVNEGPHIPNADRDKVFKPGFSTKHESKGLGLHVAKEIALGLGGDILTPENLGLFKKRVKFSIVNLPIYEVQAPAS
jgi:signal transduction histidine kinase